MLAQFYCAPDIATRAFSWVGTFVLASHSIYSVVLSRRLVDWQGRFYDQIGDASVVLAAAQTLSALGTTNATANATESNATTSVEVAIEAGAAKVGALLSEFAWIVMPMALVHPVNRYIRRRFTFAWRMCLMCVYTERWTHLQYVQLEGISQRIQEDTQRFGRGLETCVTEILDALLTLIVFTPTLVELGRTIPPLDYGAWLAPFGAAWIFVGALLLALGGLVVSLFVAHRLVGLEVQNQMVEAEFRKGLVLVEVGGVVHAEDSRVVTSTAESPPATSTQFSTSFSALRTNYLALFRHFFAFDAWVSCFDQATVIIPYAVVAPLLFRHHDSITLGTLVKTAAVFGRVFSALSLPAFNWANVNDFRSVIRRLVAMERAVGLRGDVRLLAPPVTSLSKTQRGMRQTSAVPTVSSTSGPYQSEVVVAVPLAHDNDGLPHEERLMRDASGVELTENGRERI